MGTRQQKERNQTSVVQTNPMTMLSRNNAPTVVLQGGNSPLQILAETLELLKGFFGNLENFILQKEGHDVTTDFF